jgi:hypothetical protein
METIESKRTIGQMVGIVEHTFSIKPHKDAESIKLKVEVDFSTASDMDIKSWLVSNRIIAGQKPWRNLSIDEIKDLDGQRFIAQDIGKKVQSREEKIQVLVNAGLPRNLAEFSVDNPEEFAKVMNSKGE